MCLMEADFSAKVGAQSNKQKKLVVMLEDSQNVSS